MVIPQIASAQCVSHSGAGCMATTAITAQNLVLIEILRLIGSLTRGRLA